GARSCLAVLFSFLFGHALLANPVYGTDGFRSLVFVSSASVVMPFSFVLLQTATGWRAASVVAAALYMIEIVLLMQLFQCFTATPRYGPVHHHVARFMPPLFPVLLVPP